MYYGYYNNLQSNNVKIISNLKLSETIAAISICNYFISNDSGLSHYAAMFEIKQLVLFGGTNYIKTSPYNKNARIIKPSNYKMFYDPGIKIDLSDIKYLRQINKIKPNRVLKELEGLNK